MLRAGAGAWVGVMRFCLAFISFSLLLGSCAVKAKRGVKLTLLSLANRNEHLQNQWFPVLGWDPTRDQPASAVPTS
jgi:hypothetical protein